MTFSKRKPRHITTIFTGTFTRFIHKRLVDHKELDLERFHWLVGVWLQNLCGILTRIFKRCKTKHVSLHFDLAFVCFVINHPIQAPFINVPLWWSRINWCVSQNLRFSHRHTPHLHTHWRFNVVFLPGGHWVCTCLSDQPVLAETGLITVSYGQLKRD